MSIKSVLAGVAIAAIVATGLALTRDAGPHAPLRTTTGPAGLSARATFRLAVIGDFGSGQPAEEAISDALRNRTQGRPLDALITTGDNIYPNGSPADFDRAWSKPYAWINNRGVPVIAALGNHDIETSAGSEVMALFQMPARWYSQRVGDADVIVLDANDPANSEQITWLAETLSRSDATWQIVTFHQPAFSCSVHGSTQSVIENWVPIFESGGVDLVLNGHDHNYQRFEPFNGITYVVTGGGGASLYRLRSCDSSTPRQAVARKAHNYLTLVGNEYELRLRAFGPGGRFDELMLTR